MNARIYNKQYAHELQSIAEQDLESAKVLAASNKGRHENTLFLVQQVAEKALKAVLCSKGLAVPFSHDIEALIVRVGDIKVPNSEALVELTPYATIRRYEEGRFKLTQDEIDSAIVVVSELLIWTHKQISNETSN